jgi:hypothetical protein
MATGYLPAAGGESLHMYYTGTPYTHGGGAGSNGCKPGHCKTWGNNTGVGLLTLRTDGPTLG